MKPEQSLMIIDARDKLAKFGLHKSIREVYKMMLKRNLITPDCQPTKWAIKKGYFKKAPGYQYAYPEGITKKQIEDDEDRLDMQNVLSRMKQGSILPDHKDPDNVYFNAPELVRAAKEALTDGTLTTRGQEKWQKFVNEAEQELRSKGF